MHVVPQGAGDVTVAPNVATGCRRRDGRQQAACYHRPMASKTAKTLVTTAASCAALAAAPGALAQNGDRSGETQGDLPADLEIPPAPALSPEDEHATFALPPGFTVELFAAEPMVVDPVQVTFDERGRLWVVEMRGYMRDADATGELEPLGEIAILEDTDGDGRADTRSVFAEGLVLPRGVLPMEGGALCVLPPELVFLRDDDGDGEFDVREVVATGLTRGLDNPEHAVNTPVMGLDGWVRFANWDRSVRRVFDDEGDPGWEVRRVASGGQWGLTFDELGRALRNTNPSPLHVDLVPARYAVRNAHQRGFRGLFADIGAQRDTYPSRINPGVNRGYQPATLRDDFTLARFTGACSPTSFLGDGLGPDARGDAFVCEPCGNLIKRYDVRADGAGLRANEVRASEFDFLASTDERFRPVALATGPDGALYIADMYRGVIQHRIFMTTFLRKQVVARGLETPLGQGRIWRVRATDAVCDAPEVDLLGAETVELASFLDTDHAWLREHARRLVVEFFDGEASVVAALRERARATERALPSIHALWALAAIGHLDAETAQLALGAEDSRVRAAAAEAAEPLLGLEGNDLLERVAALAAEDPAPRPRLHALLALGASDRVEVIDAYVARMTASAESALERSAVVSGLQFRELDMLARLAEDPAWAEPADGRAALLRDLAACVGREGLSQNIEVLVSLVLAPPAGWWSEPVMAGLESTRRKGPRGERLPIALRARPAALVADDDAPRFADRVDEGCTWPGKPGAKPIELPRELTPAERALFDRGAEVYAETCATCHQPHGGGQVGKAPTLRGTEYSVGDADRLARILLLGLDGPLMVDGEEWNMEMPRFEGEDVDLAAVLTYVRRSWGNGADPVTPGDVARARESIGERTKPLHADEIARK